MPQCPFNSYYLNGKCYCNGGLVLNRDNTACQLCPNNEIYNGWTCLCDMGYVRGADGKCVPKNINTCGLNQDYDYFYRKCICKKGYDLVNGQCIYLPLCQPNSGWNGQSCVCISGCVNYQGQCYPIEKQIPVCPANSYFNGKCPEGDIWDGNMCIRSIVCQNGFIFNNYENCCVPIGINCG